MSSLELGVILIAISGLGLNIRMYFIEKRLTEIEETLDGLEK